MSDEIVLTKRGPNNGKGRPVGATNYVTRDLREYWHAFFGSEEWRATAKRRILNGTAPHLESYLLQRIYGKPTERIALTVEEPEEDLSKLSEEELLARAKQCYESLAEAQAISTALPAEYELAEPGVEHVTSDENEVRPSELPADSAANSESR
jgi:hypothetical protein